MQGIAAIGAALVALAGAAPAAAQIDGLIGLAEPDENAIVVTHRPDPEPRQDEVRQQVRSITVSGNIHDEPLARFQAKLCPGVLGLPVDIAELIVGRIRYNAGRLGLALADETGCKPNLIVGFVGSGQSDVERMLSKKGSMLAELPIAERDALRREDGPVHAWAITSTRTRDGMPMLGDRKYGRMPTINTQSANSLFLLATRSDIELSVVLIDIAAIDGLSVNQLADYATMRGFARTRAVSGEASYGTILNLFDPDAEHQGALTAFDVAYLRSLYDTVPNIAAAAKFGSVNGFMKQEIAARAARSE